MKYGEAAAELDSILRKIEEGNVDIDDLSDKVQRAAELIGICRQKLEATEVRVKKVVERIVSAPAAEEADDGDAGAVDHAEDRTEDRAAAEGRPLP
jgi:exodeoxyribonuclease VII small subunit